MDPYRVPAVKTRAVLLKTRAVPLSVKWVDEDAIVITQSRAAGYMLSALLGIFSAWLVTATVDATKQAMRPSFVPQAIIQGEP